VFSVVIATRNRRSLLPDAIRAVNEQTTPAEAVIVVDDGSTDGTAAWLRSLEMPNLVVVRTEGIGVSAARNRGIDRVGTSWTVFLDDDDVPEATWIEGLTELADDGVGIVSCAARWDGTVDGVRRPRPQPGITGAALFLAGTYGAATDLLEEAGGFMEGLTYAENTELSWRLVERCRARGLRMRHTDEPLLTVRRPGPRTSTTDRHDALLRVIDAHPEIFDTDRARAAKWLSVAGVDAFRAGEPGHARTALARAFRARPSATTAGRLALAWVPPLGRRAWRSASRDVGPSL
jgi:glycosyltransferase involved in cell wall biosynthesis